MCHWVNKQWFIHKTKYYIVMKNNQGKDLFELTWSYFQDIPISKKKKKAWYKGISYMLLFG